MEDVAEGNRDVNKRRTCGRWKERMRGRSPRAKLEKDDIHIVEEQTTICRARKLHRNTTQRCSGRGANERIVQEGAGDEEGTEASSPVHTHHTQTHSPRTPLRHFVFVCCLSSSAPHFTICRRRGAGYYNAVIIAATSLMVGRSIGTRLQHATTMWRKSSGTPSR